MWKKALYKFHRILGTLLSILFMLWFLTGFVMIYHNFPKISDQEKYRGLSVIDASYSEEIDSLINYLSDANLHFETFLLKSKAEGKFLIEYGTKENYFIVNDKKQSINRQSFADIQDYATRLNHAPIIRVDTLNNLDRWVPYDKHYKDFPLYKFYYQDENKSELYVSSQTGEGIQYSNTDSRFWAWMGAIPHWLYIFNLRHYTDIWKTVVIALSGIGSLMCLSGIIIAVRSFYKRYRRKKKIQSPYKSIYKWHHVLGFIFGIFIFTFAFSGMMSLQKVPQWIIKTHNPQLEKNVNNNPLTILPNKYPLDYKDILEIYKGEIQKLEWSIYGDKPYYKIVMNDSLFFIDASVSNKSTKLYLTEDDVKKRIDKIHSGSNYKIELMTDYDNYYIHKRYKYPLPVYKVTVDDPDKSLYYINPETTETRYFNTNIRARKWTYQALHSFSIKWFLDRPVIWNILMWISMIGGTMVSITGVILSLRFIIRKMKKFR